MSGALDSYRRMFRWFSNWLDADGSTAEDALAALASGQVALVFEALGRPDGFDVFLDNAEGTHEMGSRPDGGTLNVGCPTLSERSPRGSDEPEISVTVFKNGAAWHDACGAVDTDGPGVYRVRVNMVPHHLRPFLGEEPEVCITSYPWVYSNAIVVQ